jgi:signal transduction histidine kinase
MSPPRKTTSDLPPPQRSPWLVARLVVATLVLVAITAALSIHLTTAAVEDRLRDQVQDTARLIGGKGFPLSDPALLQVAVYIDAQVVALDGKGRVLAASHPGLAERLRERPHPTHALVERVELGAGPVTLGAAPLPGRGGSVYVLFPADLVAAQAQATWLPLLSVALLAVLAALLLGIASERRLRKERTATLIQLLASVAHEIRNPLGAIRGLATSLRRGGTPGQVAPLELIASEAERLTLLADGLRVVGLPVRTLRREVSGDDAVRAVVELLDHQLEHRQVELSLDLAGAPIQADPAQVRQVVLNLVLNAADAQPEGGRVELSSRVVGDRWELRVRDEGPGVSPGLERRLFQPFVSSKPQGLGIGLYLSRRVVVANGGTLTLEPSEKGASFRVAWPLAALNSEPTRIS